MDSNTTYRFVYNKDESGGIRLVPVTAVDNSDSDLSIQTDENITDVPESTEPVQTVSEPSEYDLQILEIEKQSMLLLLVIAFAVMLLDGFILARIVWRKL